MKSRIINNAKLLTATLAFIGSLGSLIVGSLAWFASSSFLEISRFRIQIGEPEQVQIGLKVPSSNPSLGNPDSILYYDTIDDVVLKNHDYYNPWMQFKPVSSMFQTQWLSNDADLSNPDLYPALRQSYKYGSSQKDTGPAEDNFYQFEFFLKSNVRIDLQLDPSTYLIADEAKNRQTAREYGLKVGYLNRVKDAMRVSFLTSEQFVIWEPNVNIAGTTEFGGRLDILDYDQSFDYDLSTNKEYMFGEYNSDEFLVYDESARVNNIDKHTTFNALSAPGVQPLSIPLSKANGLEIAKETSVSTSYLTDFNNQNAVLLRLYPNLPQRMVVTVYAEGWDRDMHNDINYAAFALNLVFGGRYAPL